MFWAEDMSNLAEKVLNCHAKVIYGNINENWPLIMEHLMNGYPWLVPHDADVSVTKLFWNFLLGLFFKKLKKNFFKKFPKCLKN